MSRSSGTYTAPTSSWNPAVEGTTIEESDWNTLLDDIEAALTESVYTGGLGATDNRLVRTDGTDTKKIQGTGITVDDSDNISGVAALSSTTIELGHASDTTLSRASAGNLAVEGNLVYRANGTDVPLADGGTGASLADPNADRVMFWDDSAGAVTWLTVGAGLSITDTTLSAAGAGSGDVVGPASATDNAIARYDGTTGKLVQNSGVIVDDSANVSGIAALSATTIELGHASDTTLSRSSAGVVAVEGVPLAVNSTSATHTASTIELGHASDTTLARSSAGNVSIEGNVIYRAGGTDVPLADGGTGASLADPNADRIMFWDDSAGAVTWLTVGTGLAITDTTIAATGSGTGDVVGPASSTDNAIARYDGTTGKLVQNSGIIVDDSNNVSGINSLTMPTIPFGGYGVAYNISLAVSASAGALTIAIKGADGNDCSATNPAFIPFRSATATTGSLTWRTLSAASSLVISSGSTLGITSSTAFRLWVVMFDDAGTLRLGVILASSYASSQATIAALSLRGIASSTAEGGAGGADNAQTFYTSTAVTSKPYSILGYIEWGASGVTAGTWTTTNVVQVQNFGPGVPLPGQMVQAGSAYSSAGSSVTSTTFTNVTGSTITLVPTSAANFVKLFYSGQTRAAAGGAGVNTEVICTLARAGTAVGPQNNTGVVSGSGTNQQTDGACALNFIDFPNTTSSTAYTFQHKGLNTSGACTTSTLYGSAEEIMT